MSEYPPAQWVPADPSNYRMAGRSGYRHVVIHCTDGHPNAGPVAEMWQEPSHGSSAHFVIGQAGEVIQCVSLADVAWHCHASNGDSVGMEHCARTPHELGPTDPGLVPSDAQYAASAKLAAWLCRRMGLEPNRDVIQGHAEIDPVTSHRLCPIGCGWDWERYMSMVLQEFDVWTNASG